ncbi:MAG TPA: histidinol phosphate phosphatase domain-containing protein [Methanomassiliicoccaceae archaeon]|jgi:putative hydrolase|nr:histidinol phosphate phosphatase domain-containing protein [Euryarchaeota archaeon]HOB38600.1 histidinol phosphate phosphatase domain-containing protein [Methanomassiliicoccaceae archaeon]HOK27694.1 histidinol phosphate phosphatase domain-containing protein [Methanomassiliicoccaceae archaeon]HOQ26338.1 histidinol phosphate phosphatase domain-containing protein [Methanomassiliicoccaceae archaeon]HPT73353.1 histidinol phosphate phosphatase domain-containing protein [Methanomassiliicoccaceae ar
MRIDLHTHTLISDGVLLPIELARRAAVMKHEALAFTDHASMSNIERVVREAKKDAELAAEWGIKVLAGCEITHVPAKRLDQVVSAARRAGAEIIVVHGETISEPVENGTNHAAVNNPEVDILAHPGLITLEDAQAAADNGVALEITSRPSHGMTNGHVASMARRVGARLIVNTDTHAPGDLITEERAMTIAMGAGMSEEEAVKAVRDVPQDIVRRICGR